MMRIDCGMPVDLPLDQLTFAEKLRLMEVLWDDLTRVPENFPSPAWHQQILEDCRRAAEGGEEQFTDWEVAKEEIRRQVSG
jgi:hypothetical protein